MEFPDIKEVADACWAVEVGLVITGWTGAVVSGGAPSFLLFVQPVQQAAR